MYLFPRTAAECVSCGMTAQLARQGGVEHIHPPLQCLDRAGAASCLDGGVSKLYIGGCDGNSAACMEFPGDYKGRCPVGTLYAGGRL